MEIYTSPMLFAIRGLMDYNWVGRNDASNCVRQSHCLFPRLCIRMALRFQYLPSRKRDFLSEQP